MLAQNRLTKAGEVAKKEFPSTSPDTPVEQILSLVAEGNIPVAVLDEEQHLLGIITRKALIQAMQVEDDTDNEK